MLMQDVTFILRIQEEFVLAFLKMPRVPMSTHVIVIS